MSLSNGALGFSGNDIVSRVVSFVGDTSSEFLTYMQDSLNLAQMRYCKAHDWFFLQRSDILITVNGTNGVNEYDLSSITDTITGQNISIYTSNIAVIHMPYPGTVLRKITIEDLRRFDPEEVNGSTADSPSMWCPVSDTRLKIWPDTFGGGALIYFTGALSNSPQNTITCNATGLTPTGITGAISHWQPGGSGKSEIQLFSFSVVPLSGTYTLTFNSQTTSPLAFNAVASDIQAALEALPGVGAGNLTVDGNPVMGLMSLDCKVMPTYWSDYSLSPIIPLKYQEGFINYMIALGLEYIDDSRADQKKASVIEDIKLDIRDDLAMQGDVDQPRFRAMFEARLDGVGANLNALLFGFLAPYD